MKRRSLLVLGATIPVSGLLTDRAVSSAPAASRPAAEVLVSAPRGPLEVSEPSVVRFVGEGRVDAPPGRHGITVRSSGVTLIDPRIIGPGSTFSGQDTARSSAVAVLATPESPLDGVQILGGDLRGFSYAGVRAEYVRGMTIAGTTITDIAYAGIRLLSVQGGSVFRCTVTGLRQQSYPNSYGICLTRDTNVPIDVAPRCTDIVVSGNFVRDVPEWEGIDTHGGQRITISGNTVLDCATGIALVPLKSDQPGGGTTLAPLDCQVTGNTVTWSGAVADSTAMRAGINFVGAGGEVGSTAERATGIVRGNVVMGYGNASLNTASILCYLTRGMTIEGNRIIGGTSRGILLQHSNAEARVIGNQIEDLEVSGGQPYRAAIDVRSGANDVRIEGNSMFEKPSPTDHPRYCIYAPGSGSTIRVGANDWGPSQYRIVPVTQKNTIVEI